MSKEAMKLALEALGWTDEWRPDGPKEQAITALREALNAPLAEQKSGIKQVIELYDSPEKPAQQEPVECKTLCELCVKRSYHFCANSAQTTLIPSPPAQRTWVGLTDGEKRQMFEREDYQGWLDYINAIEAKLKEKNT